MMRQMTYLKRNRRAWTIRDLLDNPIRQTDILKLWRCRGRVQYKQHEQIVLESNGGDAIDAKGSRPTNLDDIKIWKPKKFNDGVGISGGELSKLINDLLDDKIIEPTFVGTDKGYKLKENHTALFKILVEMSNPSFSREFIKDSRKDLMNSEYAKKLINSDLIKKVRYDLNENEIHFILILVRISPSALLELLKEITAEEFSYRYGIPQYVIHENSEVAKRLLIMDLQFKAYADINEYDVFPNIKETTVFDPPYPVNVTYEIKTRLKTDSGHYEHLSTLERRSWELSFNKEDRIKLKNENKEWEKEVLKHLSPISLVIQPTLQGEECGKDVKRFSLDSSPLQYEEKNENISISF